jgi:peptide/nickel transport system ATP-binding protein
MSEPASGSGPTSASSAGAGPGTAPGAGPSAAASTRTDAADGGPGGNLVEVDNLTIRFPVGRTGFWGNTKLEVHAVEDVSLTVGRGETLGLVGESGSGKTTIGRAVLRRIDPTAGTIRFDGQDITKVKGEALRRLRRRMQLVFQDPYASLNPRMSVLELVSEPLVVHGLARNADAAREQVVELLDRCGLPEDAVDRRPHAFSGGQRQRIGIARALALQPEFIVADEPVSALDVSVRAQVVNLLQDLQAELGLSYLFIAHDLSVVRHISHRIAILYAGKLVELAPADRVYDHPIHPYTEALLSSVPVPDPPVQRRRRRIVLEGEIPNPIDPPKGCRFQTRCPLAEERCRHEQPPLEEKAPGHMAACFVR